MRWLPRLLLTTLAAAAGSARAAPSIHLYPAVAHPGDAFLVSVRGAPASPAGSVAGRPLAFYGHGRTFDAIAALPVETPPGRLAIAVTVPARRPGAAALEAALAVVDARFPSRELEVASRFVEPAPEATRRIEEDRAAFARAFDRPFGPPRFRRGFAWPRPLGVTGRFGERRVFNGALQSQHYGLDLAGREGAPVRAANDGEVVLVRDCYASGRSVVVSHGAGVFSMYFHLSRIDVREGAAVRRGERIGRVGRTGRATGPHLHFGIRVAGLYVDPASVMRLRFGERDR